MSKKKHYASIKGFNNVQARYPVYNNIRNWVIQEKIEGMNMSIVVDPSRQHLPELTSDFQPNPFYKKLDLRGRTTATDYDFSKVELPSYDEFVEALEINQGAKYILFGELCGGGIQREWYFEKPTFVLFDVQYVSEFNTFFMESDVVQNMAEKIGLRSVPILEVVDYMVDDKAKLEKLITKSLINPSVNAEGIVAKPMYEMVDKFGERIVYKTRYAHFQ